MPARFPADSAQRPAPLTSLTVSAHLFPARHLPAPPRTVAGRPSFSPKTCIRRRHSAGPLCLSQRPRVPPAPPRPRLFPRAAHSKKTLSTLENSLSTLEKTVSTSVKTVLTLDFHRTFSRKPAAHSGPPASLLHDGSRPGRASTPPRTLHLFPNKKSGATPRVPSKGYRSDFFQSGKGLRLFCGSAQRGCLRVGARSQFLVEHIQSEAVAFHRATGCNHIAGRFFFLHLLVDEPYQHV